MADIDLKTETPDTSLPSTGFLFGADSQSAASPSVYSTQAVATALLGSTSLTGATVTADSPVLNLAQTWNNAAVTFTGLKFNVPTDSSASDSLLMDFQVGGSSKFAVDKTGKVYNIAAAGLNANNEIRYAANTIGAYVNGTYSVNIQAGSFRLVSGMRLGFTDGAADPQNSVLDAFLTRRGAANLRLGAADAAGSAIAISSVASNQLTLASAHGLTTGAAVIITGTAAPAGTSLNTLYYARAIGAAVLELYNTYANATAASGTTGRVSVTSTGTSAFVRLATPFQQLSVQDFTGTDIPGQPFIVNGSRGTGTGPGGPIIFQIAPAGTTGTPQNALSPVLVVSPDRALDIYSGASGDATPAIRIFNSVGTQTTFISSNGRIVNVEVSTGFFTATNSTSLNGQVSVGNGINFALATATGTKIGTATTQKLGFWNATPIVQPDTAVAAATVAATGTGDVVAASTTFDGYTIPQIVKALRNAGLLA